MDAYYSPHPRWTLVRPLVLAGPLGTGTRAIARAIVGRTGLPFVDVDRRIEHEVGASLATLARDGGPLRVAAEARRVLERAALERPCAVIALGLAWPEVAVTHLFGRAMDLVVVRRSASVVARRRAEVLERAPWVRQTRGLAEAESTPARTGAPDDERILLEAGILLEAEERPSLAIADDLIGSLERLAGAERV